MGRQRLHRPQELFLPESSSPLQQSSVHKSGQPRFRMCRRLHQRKAECWVVFTGYGSISVSFCSALTVSSATVKNMMGRTVSERIELENSAKLLPALLACHVCTVHAQLQVPCLRGNSGRGKDLVKGSRTLLQDMEQLL